MEQGELTRSGKTCVRTGRRFPKGMRLIAALLALVMTLALLPASALAAEDYTLYFVNGALRTGSDNNAPEYSGRGISWTAFKAFKEHYKWGTKVRAVTVRAIELVPKDQPEQLTLFVDHARREKQERLQDAIEEIRGRFGKRAITNAVLMGDLKMPDDGRHIVKMPGLMYH